MEDARQKNSRATILAETGRLVEGADGPRVLLLNGSRQEIDRATGRLNVLTFAENSIDLASSTNKGEVALSRRTEMSLTELFNPDSALNARDVGKLLVEAHRRLTAPFTAASFAMVALLSVLSGAFRRHGNVLRPLVGGAGGGRAARAGAGGRQPRGPAAGADPADLDPRPGAGPGLRLAAVCAAAATAAAAEAHELRRRPA